MKELKNQNRYKKIVLILILAVLLLTGFLVTRSIFDLRSLYNVEYVQFKPIDETANWQVYRNEKYGFEIKYPAHYQLRDDALTNIYPTIVSQDKDVMLNVHVDQNLKNLFLEDWLKENIVSGTFGWTPIKVNSVPGMKSTIQGNRDDGKDVGAFFLSPDKKNVYQLLFSTQKPGMETELNVFDQMLASFRFIR